MRYRMWAVLVCVIAGLMLAAPCSAQQPGPGEVITNPGHVEYEPSADHASLTKYVLGFFLVGATSPVQTVDLPIVAPDGTGKITQVMPFSSLGFGRYYVNIKPVALVSGVPMEGPWCEVPSNEGVRSPLPATGLAVKK